MAEQDYGLFGMTPDQVEQYQLDQQHRNALEMSTLDSQGLMNYTAARLGQTLGNVFGGGNKQMEQARQRQRVSQGIDLNTPEGLMEASRRFNELGMTQEAMNAAKAAQALRDQLAKRAYTEGRTGSDYERQAYIVNNPDEFSPAEVDTAKKWLESFYKKQSGVRTTATTHAAQTKEITINGVPTMVVFHPDGKPGEQFFRMDGTPLTPQEAQQAGIAKWDAGVAGEIAGTSAEAKGIGEVKAKTRMALPELEQTLANAMRIGNELFAHPGYQQAVGAGIPWANIIHGTAAKGATALIRQLQGQSFMAAAQKLRGLGQMTDVEGEKATAAINRMDASTSEADFRAAYEDYLAMLSAGISVAKRQLDTPYVLPRNERLASIPTPKSIPAPATSSTPSAASGNAPTGANPTDDDRLLILQSELDKAVAAGDSELADGIRREIALIRKTPVPVTRNTSPKPATVQPTAPKMTAKERAQAQNWLANNPNDPRAAAIRKLIGK